MKSVLTTLLCLTAPLLAAGQSPKLATVRVVPEQIKLLDVRRPHSLLVLGTTDDGYTLDLGSQAKFSSADEKIARVDAQGWVHPVASGKTEIHVQTGEQRFLVAVEVDLPAERRVLSFRHEVMPALSKAGCNMGACHGYSLGKNGFKLSLRGSDPDQDFAAITREVFGRRVNPAVPEASILISKPQGDVPHEGGVRFKKGSLVANTLIDWVRDGTPGDIKDERQVVRVTLTPATLVLQPQQRHQLQLTAEYSDGTVRDVTKWGIFTANNTQFAEVGDDGLVTAGDAGETAIVARFERTFAATSIIVLPTGKDFTPVPVPEQNLVDRPVIEKLNRLKITPSPLASDEEFLRRVYLDLIGIQPKPDEIRAFTSSSDPNKRLQTIDDLLQRPEFVDHWSLKWGDLLQNSRNSVSSPSMFLFREFIRGAVAENMPLDQFAKHILTAKGGAADDPASVYFAISKDANDTVERSTQVFCGVRMLCARCHTHPMENWTQGDYYGLASFFSQVNTRADTRLPGVQNAKIVQLNLAAGLAMNPRTNRPQPPQFLGGSPVTVTTGNDRRLQYADWLTSPDNPFFARGLVNRIWSYFFHRGIIEPVDDIRSTNPPINPALLEALTKDFVAHKFDVRHLMRTIVTSQTYQRTSLPLPTNRHDEQNFSHAIPRRIAAESLLDCLVQATGVPEAISGAPAGFRAAQLPDANVTSPFLNLFGKPQRMEACECERDNQSNMLQALHFINGGSILGKAQNGNGRPATIVKQKLPDAEQVTELFLWTLARQPSPDELKLGVDHLQAYGDKRAEALQDLMWALLNSKDFLLVH
ncbi:Bacterial Ig-like domain (group 2) [Anatilimnocola aggregata]|uniref:Bacterial Ig-like domain (Group 2) n=1 Tax=Anatilimnocola aggregata TaxID=2528021 RepID=A0A517YKY3_9BACT|nr:DUF1553 domain-containing protein [Anatilimnocola aggregata]QDU30886.1 Bacterial Ig-like domain (group 2) [Anatilimnocola aggregata]